jgi:sulfiredoxin
MGEGGLHKRWQILFWDCQQPVSGASLFQLHQMVISVIRIFNFFYLPINKNYLFLWLRRLFLQYSGAVPGTSTRAQNGGPVILELPLDKIRRPLMRTRANDPNKVKELMDSIKEIGLQVPVRIFCLLQYILAAFIWFLGCCYFNT